MDEVMLSLTNFADEMEREKARSPSRTGRSRVYSSGCSRPAGELIRHARYFTLQLAESYLTEPLFRQILARIEALAWRPA